MNWKTFIIIILAVACISLATSRLLHKCPVPEQQTLPTQSGKPDAIYVYMITPNGKSVPVKLFSGDSIKIKNYIHAPHKPKPSADIDLGTIEITADDQDTLYDYVSEKSFNQPFKYGNINSLVRVEAKCPADLIGDSVTVNINMEQIKDEVLAQNKPSKFWRGFFIGSGFISAIVITGVLIN